MGRKDLTHGERRGNMEKRIIYTKIWRDSWFSDLSRSTKLVFIYIISNPYIGFSGYFECPDKVICFETGVTQPELDQAKIDLQGKVAFHAGWVYVKNAEKLDPIKGENNPLWKAYNKEIALVNESYQTILQEKLAINQEQKDPTEGLPRGYEAPQEQERKGKGKGNKGGVGENKYKTIESLTPEVLTSIAEQYSIAPSSVFWAKDSMVLWMESHGKHFIDHKSALQNWIRRDIKDGKIKRISTNSTGGVASSILEEKERQYANNS